MKRLFILLATVQSFFFFAAPALAATVSPEITNYTNDTLNIIIFVAVEAAVFFLVKGGYLYFASTGKPEALEGAKKTIRNALIGLVIVLAAGAIMSVFRNALVAAPGTTNTSALSLVPINSVKPSDGLTQILIDAVSAFMQNIIQSATQPIVDGILGFLTTTPNLLTNSVVLNFWLVSLGIVDSLFVVVTALLGLHFMSASSLGFDEIELKHLLPRIGLAFLGANVSLFLADYAITTCNVLVKAILDSTGGLNHAWIVNAINLNSLASGTAPLITLVFLVLFLIIAIVLLLLYISRLIMISLGAVLSPFIFLLWTLPKFADFAEVAIKTYLVTVFTVFVHIVVIQLAAAFLTLPENSNNSLISIAVAIGLFFTLLRIPSIMMQMVLFTARSGTVRKLGGQLINVMTNDSSSSATRAATVENTSVRLPRRVVNV